MVGRLIFITHLTELNPVVWKAIGSNVLLSFGVNWLQNAVEVGLREK